MQTPQRYHETKRVTWLSALINILLGIFKVVLGYIGHSQALIADGIHSFSDLLTDLLVLVAAKAGSKHPDQEHPYGHGRIETIATTGIALLLILVGLWLGYEMVHQLWQHKTFVKPDWPVIVVAVVAIIVNEWLYRYTNKIATSIHSSLLKSNALHHRSDAFVSVIVFVSVLGSLLGWPHLDVIGAVVIAILIIKMGVKLIWDSAKELIDTGADPVMLEKITEQINQVPGVVSIHELRTRLFAGNIFIDVHIIVDPLINVSEGHYIGERVRLRLIEHFESVTDVIVHIDPEDDEKMAPSLYLPNRHQILSKLNHGWEKLPGFSQIQNIKLNYLNGKITVEVYLSLELLKTHDQAEIKKLYARAANSMKEISTVNIYYV